MSEPTREQIFDKICELLKPYNPQNRQITLQSGIVSMEQVSDIKTVGELVICVKELLKG